MEKITTAGKIEPRPIVEEMQESYLDYAMSVIVSRALPDVRDGLKPVHRRILYAMWNMGLKPGARFRKSAAIVGECFVRDTLIATAEGLIPIQNIKKGDRVFTQSGLQPVTELYIMPPRPLLKITTASGLENVVTPSQPLKVVDEQLNFVWKQAKDLKAGDSIVSRQVYPPLWQLVALPHFRGRPKYLNANLAYLLGQFLSDGYYEKNGLRGRGRIGFSSADRPIIERIFEILRAEFGYEATIETRHQKLGGRTIYTIRIQQGEINAYLKDTWQLENVEAATKKIPPQLLQSPQNIVQAFLSGLYDGDGSIRSTTRVIQYSTVSETMAQQLLVLLHQLGFYTTRYCQNSQSLRMFQGRAIIARHPAYSIEVRGASAIELASVLRLYAPEKSRRLDTIAHSNDTRAWNVSVNTVPHAAASVFEELSSRHLGAGWYQDVHGEKFRAGIRHPGGSKIRYSNDLHDRPLTREQIDIWGIKDKLNRIGSPLAQQMNAICDHKLAFLEITSIKEVAPETTYDMQVAHDHEFIANGMLAHNCLGKYHPHGDVAVYDSLVRMAQDFSLRYPLVWGQGNFGSLDGDSAAAQRYTEAKLAPISEELLTDIERETVEFGPNYDATQQEPRVLPAKLPNLLLNGSMGIAVGMATNIPPHNLKELCAAIGHLIENPEATVEELMKFVPGPDFPTGGLIYNKEDIKQAYATGRGSIVMRARAEIVDVTRIIVTEVPYTVNKADLIAHIAELVKDKKLEGIRDLRDESNNKEGVRVVIELKKDAYPKKVLNQLFDSTALQTSFHVNLLALVDGIQPRVLNLKSVLEEYLKHRQEVVKRRTAYDLTRAKERAHILEGLKIAILHIDQVIATIKKSEDRDEARVNLIKKFKLTEIQANAILDMRLAQLANLERLKVETELKEKLALIKELETILASAKRILGVVKTEVEELGKQFGDKRRTEIVAHAVKEFRAEDLIPDEPTIVMITADGYLKRLPPETFKRQGRGGKGVIGVTTKEEDVVEHLFTTTTHADLLFFTSRGRVFKLKAYEVPAATRTAKGQAVVNFLELAPGEKVSDVLSLKELGDYKYLVMVTNKGLIKKVELADFEVVRRSGLIAIKLKPEDNLEWVKPSTGKDEVMLITDQGQSIRFKESDVRPMGRVAAGVRGMRLRGKDRVVGMDVLDVKFVERGMMELFVLMENGYGKRTDVKSYKIQRRGGSGVKTAKITGKTGEVIGAFIANAKDERDLIVISKKGQVLRTPFRTISVQGRATQGVRVMRFKEPGDRVASVTFV